MTMHSVGVSSRACLGLSTAPPNGCGLAVSTMSSLDGDGDDERLRLSPLTIAMSLLMPRGKSSNHCCVPSSVLTVRWAIDIKRHGPWTRGTMPRGESCACQLPVLVLQGTCTPER